MSHSPGSGSGEVAARLRAELSRLRTADPFQVLSLPITADGEAVRRAFLEATKKRHPNRFARENAEARELATEVFLVIRGAYEQLSDESKRNQWRERLTPAAPIRSSEGSSPPAPRVPTTPPRAPTTTPPRAVSTTPPRSATVPPGQRKPTNPDVSALLEAVKTRGKRFDDAVVAIAQGQYQLAREALFKLVAEDPKNRRYRVQLHLAWGLEHRAANRGEEAIRELERAVALDPECADAAEALRKLQEQRKSGLFARLFGGR